MYIDPFWCGVVATILSEVAMIIVCAVISGCKNK